MVTSRVTSESLGRPPSVDSWLCTGRNSRASRSKEKEGLFREKHTLKVREARNQKSQGTGLSAFIGPGNFIGSWVGGLEGWEVSGNWASPAFGLSCSPSELSWHL